VPFAYRYRSSSAERPCALFRRIFRLRCSTIAVLQCETFVPFLNQIFVKNTSPVMNDHAVRSIAMNLSIRLFVCFSNNQSVYTTLVFCLFVQRPRLDLPAPNPFPPQSRPIRAAIKNTQRSTSKSSCHSR